eukprot:TRINITY_DN338_c0_g1_i1.p1 TRINITY_DN338_c0_g1~~TRINITY_DN338_c0_g1_i1.p1  ORF type:complete len:344 (-),score=37.89 TRINITY_DN338_c0_g1_i1:327-1358(-)
MSILVAVLLLFAAAGQLLPTASANYPPPLSPDFYDQTCPQAAAIVRAAIVRATKADITNPGPLLRLFFHDCFVGPGSSGCGACDASLLLNHTGSEQEALPNLTLTDFDIVEGIKAELEARCPGVVSCADLLALVARFAIVVSRGPDIRIPLGRRDSPKSARKANANRCLPSHFSGVTGLVRNFQNVGLGLADVINLSGAHTIGQGHCSNIQFRLYNRTGAKRLDPTLDAGYAERVLYPTCPKFIARVPATVGDIDAEGQTFQDPITSARFDNKYYVALTKRQGLFTSDQQLFVDNRTREVIEKYASDQKAFFKGFEESLIRMGNIKVLTGREGVVRKFCFRNK